MAQQPLYIREDMAIIHAHVDGVNYPSVYSWAALEGGVVEAEAVYTRPGGGMPGLQLGGPKTRGDITVRRQMTPELQPFIIPLEEACGHTAAWAAYTLIDRNQNPVGPTVQMNGILRSVVRMNFDANNAAAGFLGLIISLNERANAS